MNTAVITTIIIASVGAIVAGQAAWIRNMIMARFDKQDDQFDNIRADFSGKFKTLDSQLSGHAREQGRISERVTRLEEWRKLKEVV